MTVREEIARTLDYIDAAQRDTWIRVGNAIKTELGDEGFDLWDVWSSSAPNYETGGMKAQWRSLRAGKVTLASLYYLAGENGYHRGSPSASDPYTRPIRSPKREIIDDSPLRAAEDRPARPQGHCRRRLRGPCLSWPQGLPGAAGPRKPEGRMGRQASGGSRR